MNARSRNVMFGVACGLVFTGIGLRVRDQLPTLDSWALGAVAEEGSVLARVATVVSTVAVLSCFAVLVAVAVKACWRQPRWPVRLVGSVALLIACAVPLTLQNVFGRPGPPGQPGSFSYPSGHATVAAAIAATAVVVAAMAVRQWFRHVLALQSGAVILTMASRVLLAEHYVTDVLGAVLGVCCVALLGAALVTSPNRTGLAAVRQRHP